MSSYLDHTERDPQTLRESTFDPVNSSMYEPGSSSSEPSTASRRVEAIVIADPQAAFGEFLAEQAVTNGSCKQARVTSSVQETLAALEGASLVLSEIDLPGGGIFELASRLQARSYPVRLAVISNPLSPVLRWRVLQRGVVGILDKSSGLQVLLKDFSQVLSNTHCLKESDFSSEADSPHRGQHDARLSVIQQLSDRQLDVLLLLAEGFSVKQVAQRLKCSLKAVDSLKYRLMKQLEFHDRVGLTRYAIRERLITP